MNMGWLAESISRNRVQSGVGQLPGGPKGVAGQSCSRMRSAMGPDRSRKGSAAISGGAA